MYVVHWLIIAWGVAIVGFRVMDLGPVLVASVAVLVATIVVSRWRLRLPGVFAPGESTRRPPRRGRAPPLTGQRKNPGWSGPGFKV